jgi:histidine triad (HIT) family protein
MTVAGADSIFTKIIKGEIPCHRVFENEHVLAFLDITPLSEGHTLVVPKRQVASYEDLPAADAAAIAAVLGPLAKRIRLTVGAEGYNLLLNNGKAAGQEIPHVHFHIIPRRVGDGLGFRWKTQSGDHKKLAELAQAISRTPA